MDYKKVFGLLLVGIIVLAAMIFFIGPGQIFEALAKANINYVLLAVGLQMVILVIWNTRWSIISGALNIPHSKLRMFPMLLLGLAINNLTPSGRGGGEPVRAYLLTKSTGVSFEETLATVLTDKIFDTFPFIVLALASMVYLIYYIHLSQTMYITLILSLVIFSIIIIFLIYLCFNEELGIKTVKWVFRLLRRFMSRDLDGYETKALSSISGFQQSLKYLMKNKRVFTLGLSLAFLVWFLELVRVYVVFLAFGTQVSIFMIASVFLVSALVGMIPALPGGLGAIDGLMILLYSMAGIPPSISTAATIVERLISYWLVSILGLLVLPYFGTGVLDAIEGD